VLKVVKFVIVPSLLAEPLSVNVGLVSPSPHLHQDIGFSTLKSVAVGPVYISFTLGRLCQKATSSILPENSVAPFLAPI
jgi:hypothetical protein